MDDLFMDYSKVYTIKIYEQDETKFVNKSAVEIKKEAKKQLKERKIAHINLRCLEHLDTQLKTKTAQLKDIRDSLTAIVEDSHKTQNSGSWIKTGIDVSATLLGGIFGGGPIGASIAGGISNQLTSRGSEYFKDDKVKTVKKKGGEQQLKNLEYQNVLQEVDKVTKLRDIIIKGIKKEPNNILEMEEEYILKRRFFPKEVRHQVEEALIEARSSFISNLEKAESFIRKSLLIPTEIKTITFEPIVAKFNKDPFFSAFDKDLQVQLKKVALSICNLSDKNDDTPERRSYYFWGDPGIGKTCAARNLAILLDLPYLEVSIKTELELSRSFMEGSPRHWQNSEIGLLASTLLSNDSKSRSYQNPVLIINDFDRVLLGDSQTALSFLISLLDLETTDFCSNYFGSNFDMRRFTIIITGNEKIPNNEKKYEALQSRLTEINFKALPHQSAEVILGQYYDKLIKKLKFLPRSTSEKGKDKKFIADLSKEKNKGGIRGLKRKLKDALEWERLSQYDAKDKQNFLDQKKRTMEEDTPPLEKAGDKKKHKNDDD